MQIYNTFGLEATANQYVEFSSEKELCHFLDQGINQPYLVVGGGSNLVFTRHYPGVVMRMANKGLSIQSHPQTPNTVLVTAAAGEVWDDFVHYCILHQCYGAENLVAIPGCVGAAPVQNVGAYGVEAKDIIHEVRAIHIATAQPRIFKAQECQFGYRSSIFKTQLSGQYIITSVTFALSTQFTPQVEYQALRDALTNQGISHPTPTQLADTITQVRWSKLPRPEEMGSAGSFFKNPEVSTAEYEALKERYPDLVAFPLPNGYKLSAGWLIQQAGWKGRSLGRCGVYAKQALVLVNHGQCAGSEVLALADAITSDVKKLFGVSLQKEAIII